MNKRLLQSFSAGMITATSVLAITFYLGGYNQPKEPSNKKEITDEDIVRFLDQNEQVAISKEEYEQLKNALKEKEEKKPPAENSVEETPKEEKEEPKQDAPKTISITIKEGMATSDVSKLLESAGVIKSSSEFNKYLIEHEYHTRVQIGTFEVRTDMSFYEIAEAITR